LRIPIEVEGAGADGQAFRESTFTLVINRHGARICLTNSPRPGDRVNIADLQNQIACPFRVVGPTGKSSGAWPEWGVECLDPDINFWGVYFPPKAEGLDRPDAVDALLECTTCHFRELTELSLGEYKDLVAHASLRRECHHCDTATAWKFSSAQYDFDEVAPPAPSEKMPRVGRAMEKRREERLTARVPVRLRTSDGREELTRTEDLPKTGACFESELSLKEGDRIHLTLGERSENAGRQVAARVVWRKLLENSPRSLYGVSLEEDL
jgi:hypothetical protein